MKKKDRRVARFSIAGLVMVLGGAGIALGRGPIYAFAFRQLSIDRQLEIMKAEPFFENLPLLLGFVLLLAGTFLLTYGRAGLIARSAPLANRLLAFAPPAKLMLGALLFFLPWINVQCQYRMQDGSGGAQLIATQTGFQAALGTTTNRMARNPFEPQKEYQPFARSPAASPLVATAWTALTLGAIGGFLLRNRPARLGAVGFGALAGIVLLLVQHAYGYPIAAPTAEQNQQLRQDPQYREPDSRLVGPPQLQIRFTWWYYAALALPVAALVAAVADSRLNRGKLLEYHAGPLDEAAIDRDRL